MSPAVPTSNTELDTRRRELATALDSALHAAAAPQTGGLSPISLLLAQADWILPLATQPAQALRLAVDAQRDLIEGVSARLGAAAPLPVQSGEDLRFSQAGSNGRTRRWCRPIAAPKPGGRTPPRCAA